MIERFAKMVNSHYVTKLTVYKCQVKYSQFCYITRKVL